MSDVAVTEPTAKDQVEEEVKGPASYKLDEFKKGAIEICGDAYAGEEIILELDDGSEVTLRSADRRVKNGGLPADRNYEFVLLGNLKRPKGINEIKKHFSAGKSAVVIDSGLQEEAVSGIPNKKIVVMTPAAPAMA